MREPNNFHAVHADASADPRLHGIARGLGLLFAVDNYADVPDELSDLVARLRAQDADDEDGPGYDGEV